MSGKLNEVLFSKDPQAISKYIKLHLSQQPADLQRIYKQLSAYQTKVPEDRKPFRIVGALQKNSQPTNTTKYKTLNYKQAHSSKFCIDRTKKIMRIVKDRFGFHVNNNEQAQQQGMKQYKNIMDKIIKPLKVHPGLELSINPKIARQIQRYRLNKDYYDNNVEDALINPQQYDLQMKQFLDRKKYTLHQVFSKKNSESTVNCFSNVQSKFMSVLQLQKSSRSNNPAIEKTYSLFKQCDNYRSTCKLPRSISVNHYDELKHRVVDQKKDQVQEYIMKKMIKSSTSEALDKYTNSYLKMMASRIQKPCKLNKHQKDLMKNQRKMRNIINFSDKSAKI